MVEQSEGGDFPPKKAQSETTAQQPQPADFPPKKLARQLDFTAGYTGGPSAVSASSSSSPSCTATPTVTPAVAASGDHSQQSQPPQPFLKPSQPQLQQHIIRPSQPPIQLMTMPQPPVPPTAHPPIRPMKPESPRTRPRSNANEGKDGTLKKQKQCNCKHSKCLKLWNSCFGKI